MDQPDHRVKRVKSKITKVKDSRAVEIQELEVVPPSIPIRYEIVRSDIPDLHFLGLFDNKVIVTYCSRLNCFVYFDQHAIHERIRYEFYIEALKNELAEVSPQMLQRNAQLASISPQIIEHRTHKIRKVVSYKSVLRKVPDWHAARWGFSFMSHSGEYYLTAYPNIFGYVLTDQEIDEALGLLSIESVPKPLDRIIASTSCKGAVKFNESIGREFAEELLRALGLC